MTSHSIFLSRDFTRAPGGRFKSHGPHSGEEFRERLIRPALREHQRVTVVLDGALGLPASFLDEAIGALAPEIKSGKLDYVLNDNPIAKSYLERSIQERN